MDEEEGMSIGVLLLSHGTVERLDDLPAFLTKIRRGHAPPPELVSEVRSRYEAIGGRSPLADICRSLASKLEAQLKVPVRAGMRLWHPDTEEAMRDLVNAGARDVIVLPLAPFSLHVYMDPARLAAEKLGATVRLVEAWHLHPALIRAYAARVRRARTPDSVIVFTAHSLPSSLIASGDPYESLFRATVSAIALEMGDVAHRIAFQSQGLSSGPGGRPVAWLGPDLRTTLSAIAAEGAKRVLVAPIGFLSDHVEILYDIDIEAKRWAEEDGLSLSRTSSLNDDEDFCLVLKSIVESEMTRS